MVCIQRVACKLLSYYNRLLVSVEQCTLLCFVYTLWWWRLWYNNSRGPWLKNMVLSRGGQQQQGESARDRTSNRCTVRPICPPQCARPLLPFHLSLFFASPHLSLSDSLTLLACYLARNCVIYAPTFSAVTAVYGIPACRQCTKSMGTLHSITFF